MMRRINKRFWAGLLLLAFLQKMGLELWLHHWLHEPRQSTQWVELRGERRADGHSAYTQAFLLTSCHCLDDAMMPLLGQSAFRFEVPFVYGPPIPLSPYASFVSRTLGHAALRGPPAFATI